MMEFTSLRFNDGKIEAFAYGHPTEVVEAFHDVASSLLGRQGAWRITSVNGGINSKEELDSNMQWVLVAEMKK